MLLDGIQREITALATEGNVRRGRLRARGKTEE